MKAFLCLVLVLMAVVLILQACGSQPHTIYLRDGKVVHCLATVTQDSEFTWCNKGDSYQGIAMTRGYPNEQVRRWVP